MRNREDLLSASLFCRDRMNPYLFIYSLSVALLHRPDTRNLPVPTISEVFPEKFVDSTVWKQAKEEANIIPEGSRVCDDQRLLKFNRNSFYCLLTVIISVNYRTNITDTYKSH